MKRKTSYKSPLQYPPAKFTKEVVVRIADKYAQDQPVVYGVGWKLKVKSDNTAEAIVGFFTYKPARKSQLETTQLDIPKKIDLKELFPDNPGDLELYGIDTVTTRTLSIRSICNLRKKKKKKINGERNADPAIPRRILQPGEVIYSAGQNELGSICAIVDIEQSPGRFQSHILSAQHVLTDDTFVVDRDSVFQPDEHGVLEKVGTLSQVGQPNNTDLFAINDFAIARIESDRPRSSEILGVGLPSAPVDDLVTGDIVVKSGHSSKVTVGRIDYTSVSLRGLGQMFGRDIFGFTIVPLAADPPPLVTPFATDGDSGSVIAVRVGADNYHPAGLLISLADMDNWMPGFIALSITDILRHFNATMHPNPAPSADDPEEPDEPDEPVVPEEGE